MLNSKGQALIQALIATAVLGILMSAVSAMLSMHQTENRRLSDNLAKMDLERVLTSNLQDGSVCTFILTNPQASFDPMLVGSSTPPEFSFLALPITGTATSPAAVKVDPHTSQSQISPNLFIKTIKVKDLVCASGPCTPTSNLFTANIVLDFDATKLVSAVAPLALPVAFKTSLVGAGPLQKVDACLGTGSTGPGGPVVTGPVNYPGAHTPGCVLWKVKPYNTMIVQVWGAGGGGLGQWGSTAGQTSSFGSVIALGGTAPAASIPALGGNAYGGDIIPDSDPPTPDPASNIRGTLGDDFHGGTAPGPGGGAGGGYGALGDPGYFWGSPGKVPGGGGGPGRNGPSRSGASGGYAKRTFQPGELTVGSYVTICIGAGGSHSGATPSYVPGDGGAGDVRITIN